MDDEVLEDETAGFHSKWLIAHLLDEDMTSSEETETEQENQTSSMLELLQNHHKSTIPVHRCGNLF